MCLTLNLSPHVCEGPSTRHFLQAKREKKNKTWGDIMAPLFSKCCIIFPGKKKKTIPYDSFEVFPGLEFNLCTLCSSSRSRGFVTEAYCAPTVQLWLLFLKPV